MPPAVPFATNLMGRRTNQQADASLFDRRPDPLAVTGETHDLTDLRDTGRSAGG